MCPFKWNTIEVCTRKNLICSVSESVSEILFFISQFYEEKWNTAKYFSGFGTINIKVFNVRLYYLWKCGEFWVLYLSGRFDPGGYLIYIYILIQRPSVRQVNPPAHQLSDWYLIEKKPNTCNPNLRTSSQWYFLSCTVKCLLDSSTNNCSSKLFTWRNYSIGIIITANAFFIEADDFSCIITKVL